MRCVYTSSIYAWRYFCSTTTPWHNATQQSFWPALKTIVDTRITFAKTRRVSFVIVFRYVFMAPYNIANHCQSAKGKVMSILLVLNSMHWVYPNNIADNFTFTVQSRLSSNSSCLLCKFYSAVAAPVISFTTFTPTATPSCARQVHLQHK